MSKLLAIDIDLSPQLFDTLCELVASRTAFCLLDQRLNASLKQTQLAQLGATHVLSAEGEARVDNGREVDEQIGVVMLTSGSSGSPKAAELSWEALEASARITSTALAIDEPSIWVPILPPNHIGGLAVLLRAAFGFAGLRWTLDVARAPSQGATHIAVVQAQAAQLDLSKYRHVLLGGAKPPKTLGTNVTATWGMTETGSGIVYDGVPLPGVEVAHWEGELLVRTPTLFTRYRDALRPTSLGPDGREDWFPTGDAGMVEQGVVKVFGRIGSVITTGGEKVWPEQLEQVLRAHPFIHEVGITSVPDSKWGQAIVAVVRSSAPLNLEELSALCEAKIGPWAKPKYLLAVPELPKTANGKLQRARLAEIAILEIVKR